MSEARAPYFVGNNEKDATRVEQAIWSLLLEGQAPRRPLILERVAGTPSTRTITLATKAVYSALGEHLQNTQFTPPVPPGDKGQ